MVGKILVERKYGDIFHNFKISPLINMPGKVQEFMKLYNFDFLIC